MSRLIKNLVLDMDGVLWRGDTPMPGLVEFFAQLRQSGIGFVLATNNAGKTAAMYTERLAGFGVDIPPEKILTSAEATAAYLSNRYPADGRQTGAYVVGEAGLREAMTARGFRLVDAAAVRAGEQPALVVVGFTRYAVYEDLAMASLAVHRGALFVGANPDPSIPSEIGPLPGAGALLAFIQAAAGVAPLIIGKPGPIIFEEAVRRLGGEAAATAMVGDRLSTDIVGAKAAGLQAILLLSGISTLEEVETAPVKPDYVFADIRELGAFLSSERR